MGEVLAALDLDIRRASDLTDESVGSGEPWSLPGLRGRLVELVGGAQSANISAACRLIVQAQMAGDFAAWVATHRDVFFPPDVAAAGVDLGCLPVVWALPQGETRFESRAATRDAAHGTSRGATRDAARCASRGAERLLRSGAFGLIIIDLARDLSLDSVAQGRLLRLAEHHAATVLILRRKRIDEIYSGSLVTVRGESSCEQIGPGRFRATIANTKDKREGPGWTADEEFDGPPGLY